MRVVSLACSNTEIVCALGCADLLVGCDDHSDHPADVVAALPRVGRDLDIRAADVAALKPDLVLASLTVPGHEKVLARLAEFRLNLLVLAPTSLADVARDLRQVGRILGVPERGEAEAARFEAAMAPRPVLGRRPRLLVEWWPKPCIAAGPRSWVQDLITAAGGENALAGLDCESTSVSVEQAVELDPEAVILSWCGVPLSHYRPHRVLERPGWQGVSAVSTGSVTCISEALLGRPGPRLVEGLEGLRAVVEAVVAADRVPAERVGGPKGPG